HVERLPDRDQRFGFAESATRSFAPDIDCREPWRLAHDPRDADASLQISVGPVPSPTVAPRSVQVAISGPGQWPLVTPQTELLIARILPIDSRDRRTRWVRGRDDL